MFQESCKTLLVRGVNWIGDAVMTLPALRSLRKAMPGSRISLLVKPWVSPLFEKDPNVDEIIMYDDAYKGIIGKVKLSRMLRKKDFCAAVLFQNAFDAALITFLAGIKERVGYNRDGRGFLLTKAVTAPQKESRMHHINYYLNLLEQIGIDSEPPEPYLYLSLDERLSAREILKDMRRPIVGINPGATYGSAKRWFPERFAEVAHRVINEHNGSAVIFGGAKEAGMAEQISVLVSSQMSAARTPESESQTNSSLVTHSSLLNMAGRTGTRDLIALISECDLLVTNDSGPMHLSYAVGTPVVAIFGSTDPDLTGPLEVRSSWSKAHNIVIKKNIECSPCFERECHRGDLACMEAISAEEVYSAVKELLPEQKAVFFDRDGTLCRDAGYLYKYDDLQIFTDIESVGLLKRRGFKLIGVTNQSGIAKGIIKEDFVKEVNKIFIEKYDFDDFYYCPHHPEERCPCRKPELGMPLTARAKHGIDFRNSYIVGDKETDMLVARAVGAKGILVQTGQQKESPHADFVLKNLKEVVEVIIRDSG
jgi:heptosyltransferase-2